MMLWHIQMPYGPEALGIIPDFLSEEDPRPAREQFGERYISGWNPMPGFTLDLDGSTLRYPGDPPFRAIAFVRLRHELIVLFEHEVIAIIQPDQSFEAARMD